MKRLLVLGSHRYRTILVQVNPDRKPIWIHPKDVALACALRPADIKKLSLTQVLENVGDDKDLVMVLKLH